MKTEEIVLLGGLAVGAYFLLRPTSQALASGVAGIAGGVTSAAGGLGSGLGNIGGAAGALAYDIEDAAQDILSLTDIVAATRKKLVAGIDNLGTQGSRAKPPTPPALSIIQDPFTGRIKRPLFTDSGFVQGTDLLADKFLRSAGVQVLTPLQQRLQQARAGSPNTASIMYIGPSLPMSKTMTVPLASSSAVRAEPPTLPASKSPLSVVKAGTATPTAGTSSSKSSTSSSVGLKVGSSYVGASGATVTVKSYTPSKSTPKPKPR